MRVTNRLTEDLDRHPTDNELAEALGISVAELSSYQSMAQPRQMVSLDEIAEKARGDESLPLGEKLPDPHATAPDSAMLFAEDRRLILHCLRTLPKTQATVIALHYLQSVPLREVASILHVTPSRVSQLHHQALDRMAQAWRRLQTLPE